MGILTFKGGVHPYDGKELSKNSPVVKYLPKGDMVYPLSQHIGAPAAAIVQKGDHVLAGQKIADAAGFVSSPIHSSVSGTVKGIEFGRHSGEMRQGKRNIRYGFFCFPVFYNIGKFFLSYIIKRSAGCARCCCPAN